MQPPLQPYIFARYITRVGAGRRAHRQCLWVASKSADHAGGDACTLGVATFAIVFTIYFCVVDVVPLGGFGSGAATSRYNGHHQQAY